MAGDKYTADTSRLRAASENIKYIGDFAGSLNETFNSQRRPTDQWPGINDEYALQAGQTYRQNVNDVLDIGTAIFGAIAGIAKGTLDSTAQITGTQGYALDSIAQVAAQTSDESTGGGKH
ncbi:hypothetical protein [Streptomyces sp. STR69]|uniref:hypothetical protein n=1 Tax=Streptomyces sp. STR69 TaxID=1796942 RepID=UPI0021C91DF7|nr:hypothetical protein [Streptomyces sp. STR69]